MKLLILLLAALLAVAVPDGAAQTSSSPEAAPSSPADDTGTRDVSAEPSTPGTSSVLPVSLDRIREQLAQTPAVPRLRGLNEQPTFRSGVEERVTLEHFFRPEDFQTGPVPPGGLYAYEMQRATSNPVSDPLAQPYAAFSGGQLLTIAIENLIFRYLGGRLTQAFADDSAAQAAAEAEVARAVAQYCAAQPRGGAGIQICDNRTATAPR